MAEGEWKIGREFTVLEDLYLEVEGIQFQPGVWYAAESFGRIRLHGTVFTLSTVGRRRLLDAISWKDAPAKVAPILVRLIKQDPKSPFIRTFLRANGVKPPARATAPVEAKEWLEFIEKAEVKPPDPALQAAQAARMARVAELQRRARDGTSIRIHVEANANVSGSCRFQRSNYYEGDMRVPLATVMQGVPQTLTYIQDNIYEDIEPDPGDCDYFDEEEGDDGGLTITNRMAIESAVLEIQQQQQRRTTTT